MKTLKDVMRGMPADRRRKIEAEAARIIAEVDSLAALRGVPGVSQENLAKAMSVSQPVISRMERQSDMLLSTLRGYIAALGGELDLVVRFPGVEPLRLAAFSDVIGSEETGRKRSAARRHLEAIA